MRPIFGAPAPVPHGLRTLRHRRPLAPHRAQPTGGTAYKAAELTRLLVKEARCRRRHDACGYSIHYSDDASGICRATDLWNSRRANAMGHARLAPRHTVVAPASADFIAKLANGLADDLLSTLCLARDCPLLVAPTMNVQMWSNPATQRNVEQLRADGVEILGPGSGGQACGEVGDGRMIEPEEILAALFAWSQPKLLAGKRVLLTAGPTFEAIDPVRGITNTSSGKMGFALAQCAEAGAIVTLVAGRRRCPTRPACTRRRAKRQRHSDGSRRTWSGRYFHRGAAVADYTRDHSVKLKKADAGALELKPTLDVLASVASRESRSA
jgi:phosphopantothenoylcysteine decarboxylase/phosphopantothenate--cysteine ligase